jgi:hypothetical protein
MSNTGKLRKLPEGGFHFHQVANIFPLMEEKKLNELASDIKEYGLNTHIEVVGDRIVDGRNRYRALCQLGLDKNKEYYFDLSQCFDFQEPMGQIAYVLSRNLHRRHLSASQRAMVGVEIKKVEAELAKERSLANLKKGEQIPDPVNLPDRSKQGDTRDIAAEKLGVSGKMVDMAEKVIKHGTPELEAAVRNGEVAVSSAAAIVDLPPEEQCEAVADGKKGVAEAAKKANASKKKKGAAPCGAKRAKEAIKRLEKVPLDDPRREEGLQLVQDWINENRNPKEQK